MPGILRAMATTKKGWGFDTKYIDPSVRAQDDFYRYAVGAWLKSAKIPPAENRWGSFVTLRHKTDKQLSVLLREVAALPKAAPGSPEQMIRDLYRSGMDMKRRAALGITPLAPYRAKIKALKDTDGLQKLVAEFHRIGVGALWGAGVDQDFKNAEKYVLHLFQDGIGMPDRDYYLLDGAEQRRIRDAYVPHLCAMFKLMGYSAMEQKKAADAVMRIETALAKASMKREDMREPEKLDHPHTVAALARLTPGIDWRSYLKRIGADVPGVNVMQSAFLAAVEKLLADVPMEDWKYYLDWHLVASFASLLSPPFIRQHFRFYGTTLSGTPRMKPLWRRVLGAVNGCLGEQVGKLYAARHFSPEAKKKVNAIVNDLAAAYERRIKALDWMTPATKRKAVAKLRAMKRKLAYPDKWKNYKGLVITADDYAGNVVRAGEYEHKRAMRKLKKPVDRTEWYDYPQTVNAFYSPSTNDMLFPAAILQYPFFQLDADDAVNYGAIGMTIGHEMTHGFDNSGAKFDAKGNLKDWWTAADKKRFEAKTKVIEKQFSAFVVEGLSVNGKLTLGENIADLGGLSIAFEAHQLQLARTGRKDIGGFTPEQRFFLGYAQGEHELSRPEFVKLIILTDAHAPTETRVNGPLSNMQEFYDAFGVKEGDKLYRQPKRRAKIW